LSSPDDQFIDPEDSVYDASIAASAAAATSTGPPPSSETPGPIQEPLPQPGTDEDQQQDEESPPDTPLQEQDGIQPQEFDPRHRDAFTGLLFLGYLEKTITVWGHTFHLVTPSQAEKIQIGLLHKEYLGTLASEIAYQTLLVAAYLRNVDGNELPKPITNDSKDQALNERYRWVGENLREQVIDEIFSRCIMMQADIRDILAAMGKASG
jgi:hypothetical protein